MASYDLEVARILNVHHVTTNTWNLPVPIRRRINGLVYFEEGIITYFFEQGELTAGPGDVLVFPKGLRYCGEKRTEVNRFIVMDFESEPEDGMFSLSLPHVMNAGENVGMLFRKANEEWNSGRIQSALQCRSTLYAILAELIGIHTRGNRQSALLEEALMHISQHYTEAELSVEAVGSEVHISASQLRRIFQQEIGISPGQYIMKLRLELAQNLLRHEGVAVREAAARSGFSSEFYFCRLFRKKFGITPGEFKKAHNI